MRSNIKYLAIGLIIGLGGTCLLLAVILVPPSLAASLSTDTPTPTLTSALVFTSTPQPTHTALPPTSTYTITPTLIRLKTATFTNTPTFTPTVPSPTPTLSGTLMNLLERGYLTETGPLSLKGQFEMYDASIKYIRQTSEGSRIIGEEALIAGMPNENVHLVASTDEATKILERNIQSGDVVLVKGSHGAHLETIVSELGQG